MLADAFLAGRIHIEPQTGEKGYGRSGTAHGVRSHQQGIEEPVKQNGDSQGEEKVEFFQGGVSKDGLGIEKAHRNREKEMTGNGQDGPQKPHLHPRFHVGEKVEDVFKGGKTHSHTNRIDDAVDIFIEVGISS